MNSSLAVQAPQELQQWKSTSQIKQRLVAIQHLLDDVLKPGDAKNGFSGDYGIIPGTGGKPSLWKAGSEQILAMFEIAVEPTVEDLSTDDCARYRVTTRLTHAPSGNFLGAGIGEASSDESKYKWRRTYSEKEFNNTPPERRRVKFSQYKDQAGWKDKEEMQVRQEPADLANTILKMAKKRSQIDGTLTVTGCSSMFDQDLEDLSEEAKQVVTDREEKKGTATTKATGKTAAKKGEDVMCNECRAVNGHLPHCSVRKKAEGKPVEANAESKAVEPSEVTNPSQKGEPEQVSYAGSKITIMIMKSEKTLTKADKKGNQRPYMRLTVINAENIEFMVFVWHKTPQEFIPEGEPKIPMDCELSLQKKPDGTPYYALEKVYSLAGVPFEDNKPIELVSPAAEDVGFEKQEDNW